MSMNGNVQMASDAGKLRTRLLASFGNDPEKVSVIDQILEYVSHPNEIEKKDDIHASKNP